MSTTAPIFTYVVQIGILSIIVINIRMSYPTMFEKEREKENHAI